VEIRANMRYSCAISVYVNVFVVTWGKGLTSPCCISRARTLVQQFIVVLSESLNKRDQVMMSTRLLTW